MKQGSAEVPAFIEVVTPSTSIVRRVNRTQLRNFTGTSTTKSYVNFIFHHNFVKLSTPYKAKKQNADIRPETSFVTLSRKIKGFYGMRLLLSVNISCISHGFTPVRESLALCSSVRLKRVKSEDGSHTR